MTQYISILRKRLKCITFVQVQDFDIKMFTNYQHQKMLSPFLLAPSKINQQRKIMKMKMNDFNHPHQQ